MKKSDFFESLEKQARVYQIKCAATRAKASGSDKLKTYWEAYKAIERENEKDWEDFMDWLCDNLAPHTRYNIINRKMSFKEVPDYQEIYDVEETSSGMYEL